MSNIESNAIWNHAEYNKSTYSEEGVVAQASKVIPLGFTASNNEYYVGITPLNSDTSVAYYISTKTTTEFTIHFPSPITGDLLFDFIILWKN